MKHLALALLFSASISFGVTAQEYPEAEDVYEMYTYCSDDIVENPEDNKSDVLSCVNSELGYLGYEQFASMQALLDYIKAFLEHSDEEGATT